MSEFEIDLQALLYVASGVSSDQNVEEIILPVSAELVEDPRSLSPIATRYFRRKDFSRATKFLEASLHYFSEDALARSNFALCLFATNDRERMEKECERALRLDDTLLTPKILQAHQKATQGRLGTAKTTLLRAIEKDASVIAATLLAQIELALGNSESAEDLLSTIVEEAPDSELPKRLLGELRFNSALDLYTQQQRLEAYQQWSKLYETNPEVFHNSRQVVESLITLRAERKKEDEISKSLLLLKRKIKREGLTRDDYYTFFTEAFFIIGVGPTHFVPERKVDKQITHWSEKTAEQPEELYPIYRLSLLNCLRGEVIAARKEFLRLEATVPPKKHAQWSIAELVAITTQVVEEVMEVSIVGDSSFETKDWEKAGFENPFSREKWKRTELAPKEAQNWLKKDFSPTKAKGWLESKFSLDEAIAWRKAGFNSGRDATRYRNAGLDPATALSWSDAFDADSSQALRWRGAGFEDAEVAREWARVVDFPGNAMRWKECGFSPAEARVRIADGVSDPFVLGERSVVSEEDSEQD